jgi:CheY-like chemotaxis protein
VTGLAAPAATVLVVDDAEGSRLVFSSWLRRAGHTVIEAGTGGHALEVLSRTNIDLIVLDVNLPDMSGLDVCDQVKTNRATASIPVLHVSATATGPDDRSTALNRGADGYLIEPIERDELLATATSLLRYHDARRTAERLAIRLERLHQATLLMSAAPTIADLLQFACTGLVSVFGTPAVVVVAREDVGRIAYSTPNRLEPELHVRDAADTAAIAGWLDGGSLTDLGVLTEIVGEQAGPAIGAPIATPVGETVGALVLLTGERRPEDELMLDQFAQALAVSLENQRLYALEHQIALTLQRAMLPASIPQPDYLEVAVRYLAAGDTVEIGGDFYETLALSPDVTLVAVGDVVGHSLQAATVMAELRHSLRAYASMGLAGAEILERLGTMLRDTHPGMTATVCIAEIHRSGQVRIANAGHMPPVVADGSGCRTIAEHGPLLGLLSNRTVPTTVLPFGPGATLVLVTDGLVERKNEDIEVGLRRLSSCVSDNGGGAEQLCQRVLDDVGAGADTFDDIAIVVARVRPV